MRRKGFIGVLMLFIVPVLCSVLFLGSGHQAYAQGANEESRPTGLIVMTPEEAELFRRTHKEVEVFVPNEIALERINVARAKKGLPLLPPGLAAPVGKELRSSAKGEAGGAGDIYSGPLSIAVDNSTLKCFPPIGNQDGLNSCTTFATTYYQLTHTVGLIRHKEDSAWDQKKPGYPHYDMIYSPSWVYNVQRISGNDGSPFWGNYDVLQYNGACTLQTLPYDGEDYKSWCTEPGPWEEAIYQRIEPISYIMDDQIDLIKGELNNGYVVTFATYIGSWQYKRIRDNRHTTEDDPYVRKYVTHCVNGQKGGHAMTVVGYSDVIWADVNGNRKIDANADPVTDDPIPGTGELGAFRIANSWGDRWRDDGFTWLAYDALKEESSIPGAPSSADGRVPAFIERHVYVMELKQDESVTTYTPKLLAEFTLRHAKRNQLLVHLGISIEGATEPSITWYPGVLNLASGEYNFDGGTGESEATFVLDFTDILSPGYTTNKYYLGVFDSKTGDPATLKTFSIREVGGVTISTADALPLEIENDSAYVSVIHAFDSGTGNYPPQAVIIAPSTSGNSPLTVSFDGQYSSDPEGSDLKYIWFFGDTGSHPMVAGIDGSTASHTYNDPGIYAARLSVTEYDASTGNYGVTTSAVEIIDVAFGTPPEIHVKNIVMSAKKKGVNVSATAEVTIVDALGFPVREATVFGDWTGATEETNVSGVTDSEGIAAIKSSAVKKPTTAFTFTVTDVVKDGGWRYNPAANEVPPSASIDPPATAPANTFANSLQQAFPGPGNPSIWIPFTLADTQRVVIRIHDMSGRLVRTLELRQKAPGAYLTKDKAAYWDGKNEVGEQVSSGIYFYTIQAGNSFTATKKMAIAK